MSDRSLVLVFASILLGMAALLMTAEGSPRSTAAEDPETGDRLSILDCDHAGEPAREGVPAFNAPPAHPTGDEGMLPAGRVAPSDLFRPPI